MIFFREQSISVPSTSLQSELSPSGIYLFGGHGGRLPPSSEDISNPISQRHSRLQIKHKEVQTEPISRYPVSRHLFVPGSGDSFTPRIQDSGDSSMSMRKILRTFSVVPTRQYPS